MLKKSIVPALMAAFMTLNYAQPVLAQSASEKIIQEKSVDQMSAQEIHDGLLELRAALLITKEDLANAKAQEDGRLAVKVRNISFSAAASGILLGLGAVAVNKAGLVKNGVMGTGFLALVLAGGGLALGALSEGYILITPDQVKIMQARVDKIDKKIQELQVRLEK